MGLWSCSLASANCLVSHVKFKGTWLLKWRAVSDPGDAELDRGLIWWISSGSLFSSENETDPGICLSLCKERQSRVSGLSVVFKMCQVYRNAHHWLSAVVGRIIGGDKRKKPCINHRKNIGWTYEEHSPSADGLERQWWIHYSFEEGWDLGEPGLGCFCRDDKTSDKELHYTRGAVIQHTEKRKGNLTGGQRSEREDSEAETGAGKCQAGFSGQRTKA